MEIGSDPLGNIARINQALESMPKLLAEAQAKLENVEHQLEIAQTEVNQIAGSISSQVLKPVAAMADKPAQKVSLKEKPEAYKAQVAGMGKQGIEEAKGK